MALSPALVGLMLATVLEVAVLLVLCSVMVIKADLQDLVLSLVFTTATVVVVVLAVSAVPVFVTTVQVTMAKLLVAVAVVAMAPVKAVMVVTTRTQPHISTITGKAELVAEV